MAFLSLLDERAKPKGSRDPLGFELVWSYFGRKVIGNLTTITSSMDNFAIALLGFYWANQLVSREGGESARHKQMREAFLRYEQLTGYVRFYGRATDIMGITRVKKRILDSSFKITLGQLSEQQILSDQASYGLWGLYSSAARDTGLVTGNDRVVTSLGQTIAREILQQLGGVGDELLSLLTSRKALDRGQLERMAKSFMKAIHHKRVQKPLLEALMSGNDLEGVQNELWQITRKIFEHKVKRPENISEFIGLILKYEPSKRLAQYLHDIMDIERLLVAANNLFHYCRRKDGEHLDEILEKLDGRYHYSHLPDRLPEDSFPRREQLLSIFSAFHNDEVKRVISEILQLNKEVMQQRSGAPWVEIESGKTLRVKVKSEKATLRKQEDIELQWDYDYFLGSFLNIASHHLGRN
ncbi:MAG: hypothetical protein JMN27_15075 [gamma proteobacterium endosymbiont of Lamellibrachia anaximandri]|nr:hypothetical protein [gamma proteobacterium endosymbiont of Lamellibrachia anaximandri]MBL3535133.1 hypothetical protein [gamma proteobacterium endosymbiont of Lamellibrachia anaximandri]